MSQQRSALLQPYYPALDGLRAVAILLVFMIHFVGSYRQYAVVEWGWCGVDIFFVLSGFLITGILYDSLHRKDYFGNFYVRRTLRIFPLYYAVWGVLLLAGLLPSLHIFWNRYNVAFALYLGNLFQAPGMLGIHADGTLLQLQAHDTGSIHLFSVSTLWSLCVEEQFYLVWPAIVWGVRSRRKLMAICATVIVAEPVFRWVYLHHHPELLAVGGTYFSTLFRVDTLLVGAFVALWLRGSTMPLPAVRKLSYTLVIGSVIALVAAWKIEGGVHPKATTADLMVATVGFTLVALAAAGVLLLTLDSSTILFRALRHRAFVAIGRISYGLYVFHGFVNFLLVTNVPTLHRMHLPGASGAIIGPVISFGLAWFSFRYFESPFLKLKARFAPRPGAADDPPPFGEVQHSER